MADQLQLRGGTTSEHSTFTGALREVTVDTDKDVLVVHDNSTAGGHPLMAEDGSNSALALGTVGTPSLKFTGDTNTGIYSPGADTVGVSTGGTERIRIDSSGRLLVGASSAKTNFENSSTTPQFQIESTSLNGASLSILRDGTDAGGPKLFLAHGRTDAGLVSNDDELGGLFFSGGDGSEFVSGASITAAVDGTPGADDMPSRLVFSTTADAASSPTERMRIDSSGRVGIGTTSPGAALDIFTSTGTYFRGGSDDTARQLLLTSSTTTNAGDTHTIHAQSNTGILAFRIGNSERARIDSSGRLLVGTSSSRNDFYVPSTYNPQIQNEGTSLATSMVTNVTNSNDPYGPYLILGKSRGTTAGSNTIVQNSDAVGTIDFLAADGTQLIHSASISAIIDGTPGAADMPARLVFSTTADGTSSPTERMRITSTGRCQMGPYVGSGSGTGWAFETANSASAHETPTTTSFVHIYWINGNGVVGSISTNGSATAFNTSSDYRLKENVVSLIGAADRVKQLKPSQFNFIADPDTTVDGFIAHEAQAVVPECVTGTKDEVDADGNPVYQGIDQSKLVPLLTAALQEALAKIETLEQRLNDAGIA